MAKKIKYYQSKDWLWRKLYIEQLTIDEIAKEADCDPQTIRNWMKKHDL